MNRPRLLAAMFLLTLVTSAVGTASGALPLVLGPGLVPTALSQGIGVAVFLGVLAGGAGAALGSVLGLLAYQFAVPQFVAFVATPFGVAGGQSGGFPLLGLLMTALGAAVVRGTVVALAVVAGAVIAHDDSPGATPLGERL